MMLNRLNSLPKRCTSLSKYVLDPIRECAQLNLEFVKLSDLQNYWYALNSEMHNEWYEKRAPFPRLRTIIKKLLKIINSTGLKCTEILFFRNCKIGIDFKEIKRRVKINISILLLFIYI